MARVVKTTLECQSLYLAMAMCSPLGRHIIMEMARPVAMFGFSSMMAPTGHNSEVTLMGGLLLPQLQESLYPMMAVCLQLGHRGRGGIMLGCTITTFPIFRGHNLAMTSMALALAHLDGQSLYLLMAVCWQLGDTGILLVV